MMFKPKFEEVDFTIRSGRDYDPVESEEYKKKLFNALPREFASNQFITTKSNTRYEVLDMREEEGKKLVVIKFHPERYIDY